MLGRRLPSVAAVLLCVAMGCLVWGGASALALNEHLFSGFFGQQGGGNGQFRGPHGVALDVASQEVYVADSGNNRVEVFSSAGAYVGQFDGSAAPTGVFSMPNAVAVDNSGNALDPSAGDVYVVDSGHRVIDKFTSAGTYLGQITETTGGAKLGEIMGVAVDTAGVVWVYQASGEIDSFSNALGNEYISKLQSPFEGVNPGIAVDSEDNLYVQRGSGVFGKLNSSGEVLIEEVDPGGSTAAAVDPSSGEVFIDELRTVGAFSSTGSFIERFGAEQGAEHLNTGVGLAVDPTSGTVYVADFDADRVAVFKAVLVPDVTTGAASSVQPTSATLSGTVNPDGVQLSDCRFEYGASAAYGQSAPCVPATGSIPADSSEHQISANLTGLVDGSTYHYRLRAANASGANFGEDATFQTPPRPVIDSAATTNLTGSSVDLTAGIDPKGFDTTYRFEYGTSIAYGASIPVPDADIGAGTSDIAVSQHVGALQTNTTYHWRVVAHSINGTSVGSDHTFIYGTSGPAGLPDNRTYEMVTPPAKNAALIGDAVFGLLPNISEDGSRIVLSSIQCFGDATSCVANDGTVGTPFEFTRTSGGWSGVTMAPAATRFDSSDGWAVSADSGTALFTVSDSGGESWYARRSDGSFVDIGLTSPPSTGPVGQVIPFYIIPSGTADLSRFVFETSPIWPFDETDQGGVFSLYEGVGIGGTAPVLVGVSGGAGSTDLISKCGTYLGSGVSTGPYGALSDDGRTVFFTPSICTSGSGVNSGIEVPRLALYARVDESRTVPISARSPLECTSAGGCVGSPGADAWFEGASADGSRVFFLDTQQLTDSASEDNNSGDGAYAGGSGCSKAVGANGCNLYEYDFSRPAGRNLAAVSAGDSSGGGPRVQGVLAVSADGSHIYFMAKGVLTSVANDRGQTARNGAENMYVFERDAAHPSGRLAFIAALPQSDTEGEGLSEWRTRFVDDVTPNGRFLVFRSRQPLAVGETSPTRAAQVFRYDAQTGEIVRISIGEGGFNDNGNDGVYGAEIAVPQAQQLGPPRGDPTMSHDGSYVFFESPVALTPGALNEVVIGAEATGEPAYARNVYEWHQGHVYLLSDGRDTSGTVSFACQYHEDSVCLLGTDATGRNVFFTTADPLVPADTDTQVDVYDARVCTASEPCVAPAPSAPVPCQGEACHGVPGAAPGPVGPATSTFSGPGNLASPAPVPRKRTVKSVVVKCKKGRRAVRGRCVKARGRQKAKARGKSVRGGGK